MAVGESSGGDSGGDIRDATTTTFIDDESPRGTEELVLLHVVQPRSCAQVRPLGESITVGRDPGPGGLEVLDRAVSRQHIELRFDVRSRQWSVRDLGTRNGTWVDGAPIGSLERVLHDGALLRLGGALLVFDRSDDTPPASEATRAVPGESVPARHLRHRITAVAPEPSPVLIVGESGTGKESTAREIHERSGRPGPLITINCAALSPSLIESQLFGHARGSFTGAERDHLGLFRSAQGGTLFLDEIGELPVELQPKLLRAVEQGEVVPVGESKPVQVDVRVVSATNRDLNEEIEAGRFRRDLYGRLSLCRIDVPPLRARRADLMAWFDLLHTRWSNARGLETSPPTFSATALERILLAPWPENLRGLDRLVHEIGAPTDEPITVANLPAEFRDAAPVAQQPAAAPNAPPDQRLPKPTKEELLAALDAEQWNIRAVARRYDRGRRQVYRWMDSFGIRRS